MIVTFSQGSLTNETRFQHKTEIRNTLQGYPTIVTALGTLSEEYTRWYGDENTALESTHADAKTNYGCRIFYGVFVPGQLLPAATADVETLMTQLHGQMKEAIKVVKLEVPQPRWKEYGIPDKR